MIYLQLFYEFFKVGLFAIGGGLATLPFLYDIASRTGWFNEQLISNMIAISESTPGPIGINMATYAGYETAGVVGGIIATVGLVTPAIIIILLVAKILDKFRTNYYVNAALYGLRPAVTALIAAAGFDVVKMSLISIENYQFTHQIINLFQFKEILLFIILIIVTRKFKWHPIVFIAASAVIGIVFQF